MMCTPRHYLATAAVLLAGTQAHAEAPEGALTLHTILGDGQPAMHLPSVGASVAGTPAVLLVDTGAPVSVFTEDLATQAGLRARGLAKRIGSSAGGRAKARHVRAPEIWVPGLGVTQPDGALVVSLGDHLNRVDGILSPQTLASPDSWVVLDMRSGTLVRRTPSRAIETLKGLQRTTTAPTTCQGKVAGVATVWFGVDLQVGAVGARMKVDTGAPYTSINLHSPAGQALIGGATEEPIDVGGAFALASATPVPAVEVALSDRLSVRVTALVGEARHTEQESPPCRSDGLLGNDVLSHCVLVLGPDALQLGCEPPP
jgi:predicted aspartyl protease